MLPEYESRWEETFKKKRTKRTQEYIGKFVNMLVRVHNLVQILRIVWVVRLWKKRKSFALKLTFWSMLT